MNDTITVLREPVPPAASAATASAPTFSITRLTPIIGAEIGDIDLRQPLDDATCNDLRRALVAHKVRS